MHPARKKRLLFTDRYVILILAPRFKIPILVLEFHAGTKLAAILKHIYAVYFPLQSMNWYYVFFRVVSLLNENLN